MNKLLLAIICVAVGQIGVQGQTDWYVDQTSIIGGNGSMAAPFPTIQPAVAAAATGDTIYVLPGNYGGLIDFAGKGLTLVSTAGKAVTKIRGSTTFGNSEIKVFGSGSAIAHIEGFTFDSGTGTTMTVKLSLSTVELKDCDFSSKGIEITVGIVDLNVDACIFDVAWIDQITPSGPAQSATGTASIINSEFKNQAYYDFDYGSAYGINMRVAALTVDNCIFDDCGTAIYSRSTMTTIKNSTFDHQAGIAIRIGSGVIDNCSINDCDYYGVSASGSVEIRNSSISDCQRNAIRLYAASVSLANCSLSDNLTLYGEPLCHAEFGGAVTFANCRIENNNTSQLTSGTNAVSLRDSILANNAGRIFSIGAIDVERCSIYGNNPVNGTIFHALLSTTIRESIVWSNTGNLASGMAVVQNSNIEGGWNGLGSGNVNIDPLFVDPTNGDFHLQSSSAMIDAGSAIAAGNLDLDIDGDARVIGRYSDIGADEFDSGGFALRGTDEDFAMSTKLNLVRVNGLGVDVAGGDLVSLSIQSPSASYIGSPVYVFGEIFTTGGSPILPVGHPAVHLNLMNADLLFDPALAYGLPGWAFGLPMGGLNLTGPVPFGFSGLSYRVQAFAVWPLADNGWYAATDAVDLVHP